MEKSLKRQLNVIQKNLIHILRPIGLTTMTLLLAACAANAEVQKSSNLTPTIEPTPIVSPTSIPIPIMPSVTSTSISIATPTSTSTLEPTSTVTEQSTSTPQKIVCKYYSGSSSYDRLGKYLYDNFKGEKRIDESKGYAIISMIDSSGNMVIFITKSGAMVSFINEVLINKEILKQLPCNPKQVVKVDILIGGNNETNKSIPTSVISREITDVSKELPIIYSNAEVTVHLPYITQEDDKEVWDRRNSVDNEVTTQLQGVKRVTVIPLSQYVVSGNSVIGNFADTLHMDPQFLLKLLGGNKTVYSFSNN